MPFFLGKETLIIEILCCGRIHKYTTVEGREETYVVSKLIDINVEGKDEKGQKRITRVCEE